MMFVALESSCFFCALFAAQIAQMKKVHDTTPEQFDRLLQWLHPDRDQAVEKYLETQERITTFFAARRCPDADDLTTKVFDRVLSRVDDWSSQTEREPIRFFFGVAKKVLLEQSHRPVPESLPPDLPTQNHDEQETVFHCLEKCLAKLPPDKRALLIAYYQDDKRAKIDHRKELAKEHEMTDNALRLQVFRLRNEMETCLEKCLERENA